jgi:hypothetical protein
MLASFLFILIIVILVILIATEDSYLNNPKIYDCKCCDHLYVDHDLNRKKCMIEGCQCNGFTK